MDRIGGCFDTLLEASVVIVIYYIIRGLTVHSTFLYSRTPVVIYPASPDSEIQRVFLNKSLCSHAYDMNPIFWCT